MRGTPRRPPDGEWEGAWLGEGVGMDHGKGAGTTEPAAVRPAGDAGPIKPGGTKTRVRTYGLGAQIRLSRAFRVPASVGTRARATCRRRRMVEETRRRARARPPRQT